MTDFQIPNFDRIHAFLEERLGTSDVLMRYGHTSRETLTILANREANPSNVYSIRSLSKVEKDFLQHISADGPEFIEDFMNMRIDDSNDWVMPFIPVQKKLFGTDKPFAWSFSPEYALRVVSPCFPIEYLENVDLLMAHEAIHAAINKSRHVLNINYGLSNGIYDEAIAMNETVEYQYRYGSVNRAYDDLLLQVSREPDIGRRPHSTAARWVLGGYSQIETARKLIYDSNKRLGL